MIVFYVSGVTEALHDWPLLYSNTSPYSNRPPSVLIEGCCSLYLIKIYLIFLAATYLLICAGLKPNLVKLRSQSCG